MVSPVALKAFSSNKTFDPLASCEELRVSSSLARFHNSKNGIATRDRFSLWTGPFPGCFQCLFSSRRDQKRARQIYTLERVATLFLGLRHDAQSASSCFKSSQTTKAKKNDTNIHVLHSGSQNPYIAAMF